MCETVTKPCNSPFENFFQYGNFSGHGISINNDNQNMTATLSSISYDIIFLT